MRLTRRVHLVASGRQGLDLTHRVDCNVYLLDGGTELALVDAGSGLAVEELLRNAEDGGVEVGRIKYLLLTHGHADHCGGAHGIQRLLPAVQTMASRQVAQTAALGNERAIHLDAARRAGVYPEDYVLHPFAVDRILAEQDSVAVGDLQVRVQETPGHCAGHLSFSVRADRRNHLFSGDLVFFGGMVLVQHIDDCDVHIYGESMRKFAGASVDVLLPGHLLPSLQDGQRHIDKALEAFARLRIPPSIG